MMNGVTLKTYCTSWLHVVIKSLYRCLSKNNVSPQPAHPPSSKPSSPMLNDFSRYVSHVLRFLSSLVTLISTCSFILSVSSNDLFQSWSKGQDAALCLQIIISVPSIDEGLYSVLKALSRALSFFNPTIPLYGTYVSHSGCFSRIACCDQHRNVPIFTNEKKVRKDNFS